MKFKNLFTVLVASLIVSACGSNENANTATGPVVPGGPGVGIPGCPWCVPGSGGATIFATGVGMYYGNVFELAPGIVPNPGMNVGYNNVIQVFGGQRLQLTGTARWAEFDYDFEWTHLFGWYETNDFCDDLGIDAEVSISYGNQPAFVLDQGTSHVVNTGFPTGVYYGYNPNTKPGNADCLILNSLQLSVF